MVKILFYFAVVASLISQLPMVLESGLDQYLKLSWIPVTVLLILLHPSDIADKRLHFFYYFILIFGWYQFILEACTTRTYLKNGGDFYNIVISLLIFIDCFIFWKRYASKEIYKNIIIIVLIGCSILATVVYFFFLQYMDMDSTTYGYDAKNSLAQILFVGGVMGLLGIKLYKDKISRIFVVASIMVLLVVIMLLKSRATIMCVGLVVLFYIFKYGTKKIRQIVTLGTIMSVLLILMNKSLYKLFVVNILFANRDASSLSNLSSGRSDLILKALKLIDDNWLFGVGHKYLDCMPIAIQLQYGVVGLIIVMGFLIILSYKVIRLRHNNIINVTAFLIYWSYIVNSLFEAYPPFGPGVKCFPLWMLLGFALSNSLIQRKNTNCKHVSHSLSVWVDRQE